jgi:Zn-dependent M28 family amino/carboxypeptidase
VCGLPGGGNDSVATAPGADDDGSGTSAIMELARVFSKRYPKGLEHSVIFVAVASEEQASTARDNSPNDCTQKGNTSSPA